MRFSAWRRVARLSAVSPPSRNYPSREYIKATILYIENRRRDAHIATSERNWRLQLRARPRSMAGSAESIRVGRLENSRLIIAGEKPAGNEVPRLAKPLGRRSIWRFDSGLCYAVRYYAIWCNRVSCQLRILRELCSRPWETVRNTLKRDNKSFFSYIYLKHLS